MQCTWPLASPSAMPAPSFPGTVSPSSPHPWLSKSPQETHPLSSKTASYSSTASARSGRCGRPPPLLNALSAGNLATQLLAARKAPPTLNAVASVRHLAHSQSSPLPSMPLRTNYAKKIDGVCPHASPKCVNCDADHPANSPSCPKRVEALAEQRARANKLVRGSPPS